MKGYVLKVYFKPTDTLRQILMQPKDKVIKERYTDSVMICQLNQLIMKRIAIQFLKSLDVDLSIFIF